MVFTFHVLLTSILTYAVLASGPKPNTSIVFAIRLKTHKKHKDHNIQFHHIPCALQISWVSINSFTTLLLVVCFMAENLGKWERGGVFGVKYLKGLGTVLYVPSSVSHRDGGLWGEEGKVPGAEGARMLCLNGGAETALPSGE